MKPQLRPLARPQRIHPLSATRNFGVLAMVGWVALGLNLDVPLETAGVNAKARDVLLKDVGSQEANYLCVWVGFHNAACALC